MSYSFKTYVNNQQMHFNIYYVLYILDLINAR